MNDEIKTMIWHETNADGSIRVPHCCGCWNIKLGDDGPSKVFAECNECGERRALPLAEPHTRTPGPVSDEIRVVFDGPPGPETGRFVEVHNSDGVSISAGVWVECEDGYWELRISGVDLAEDKAVREIAEEEKREAERDNGQLGVGA